MSETIDNKDRVVDESLVKELESIKQTNQTVQTSSKNRVQLTSSEIRYAGFWFRVIAFLIDSILLNLFFTYALSSFIYLRSYSWSSMWNGMSIIGLRYWGSGTHVMSSIMPWLITIIYFAGMHAWRGQTIGKMALRIKVVQSNGTPVNVGQSFLREIARILSQTIFGLGYIWMLWDKQRRTWHDLIAKTIVIKQ